MSVFRNSLGKVPPTLLTTVSRRPNSSNAAWARPATASVSLRSAGTTSARRPAARIFSATLSSWCSVRLEITTSAPASANATAVAAPIPLPAPVTTATWSVIANRSRIVISPPAPGR